MTAVSIKSGTTTFTFDDGEVDSVDVKKNANLDENTLPASDSNSAFILDFNGVKKDIIIAGYLYDSATTRTDIGTTTTIAQQIDWLTAIPAGNQTGVLFNSTYQTNKKVYVRSMSFIEKAGEVNKVEFRMEFVEGM